MTKKTISLLASFACLLTACIWGFAFVVVKDSLNYVPSVYMLAFRFTIAVIGLFIIFRQKLKKISKDLWKNGAFLGFILFLAFAVQTVGCKYTTAGKNAFLTTIYVILVPLLGWPLKKRRPGWYVFVSAVLAIIGIALLVFQNGFTAQEQTVNKGDILTLLCGLLFAIHILCNEKFNKFQNPITLTILQLFFAGIFSWIAAPLIHGAPNLEFILRRDVILGMLYLGLLSTMLALLLQNISLKYIPSSTASLLLSLESVFGVFFSALFLHEQLTITMITGCIIIFLAILLAENGERFFLKKEIPATIITSSIDKESHSFIN